MLPEVRRAYDLPRLSPSTINRICQDDGLAWVQPTRKMDTLRPGHIKNRLSFCRAYKNWTAGVGGEWRTVLFADEKKVTRYTMIANSQSRRSADTILYG